MSETAAGQVAASAEHQLELEPQPAPEPEPQPEPRPEPQPEPQPLPSIDALPEEMLLAIFSYLSTEDLCKNVSGVSEYWQALAPRALVRSSLTFRGQTFLRQNFRELTFGELTFRMPTSRETAVPTEEVLGILRAAPNLRSLELRGRTDVLQILLELPGLCTELRRVVLLTTTPDQANSLFWYLHIISDGALAALAGCSGLRELNLDRAAGITIEGLMQLRALTQLESLQLAGVETVAEEDWLRFFCRTPWMGQLRELSLPHCSGVSDGVLAAVGTNCPRLRKLNLHKCTDFTEDGLVLLLQGCGKHLLYLNVMGVATHVARVFPFIPRLASNLETLVFKPVYGGDHLIRLRAALPHLKIVLTANESDADRERVLKQERELQKMFVTWNNVSRRTYAH